MPFLELTGIRTFGDEDDLEHEVFVRVNDILYSNVAESTTSGMISVRPGESVDLTDLRAYPYGGIYFQQRATIRLYASGSGNDQDWIGEQVVEANDLEQEERSATFDGNDEGGYQLSYIVLADDASTHPIRGQRELVAETQAASTSEAESDQEL